ncbi:hypothetical protein A5821_002195 [Enterococcus sp. 7F3_DIV0205]|uniref:OmpR/PhoB-type domain-containing protein n=1 Tax=Candidatus Enterococcus palustris TaxID=1834189 RepID=A0AAQ3WA47_9ENTE|nr:winged helix-turn-helix domain-containing protein [Enterococcus sp. 7F3_DIV0205]OTN82634.1 hypothetical protein A5821_002545 [Enterococcus sp. 7F3_DIV0205]
MYFVGILSMSAEQENVYLNVLKRLDFDVKFIPLNTIEQHQKYIDTIIIDETGGSTSGNSYEIIMKVRSVFDKYLLLLTKNRTTTTDLVYLRLGVDGIASEDTDYEVTFTQLKRVLEVSKKPDISNESKKSNQVTEDLLKLNPQNRSVLKNGTEEIELTNTEYQILIVLINHIGTAISYDELYQKVWGKENQMNRNRQSLVTNVVFKLRAKIGKGHGGQSYIKTVRTKGYMFNPLIKIV